MGSMQRHKGARAEREVAKIINEALGSTLGRDLDQYRQRGRGDLVGDPLFEGISFEVKNQKSWSSKWWDEAVAEADADRIPVLLYKLTGTRWRISVPASLFLPDADYPVTTDLIPGGLHILSVLRVMADKKKAA